MNMRTVALVAVVAGLAGFLISKNIIPLIEKNCTEPVANFVCTFNGNKFKDPQNANAFIAALGSATFRHNMVIVDDNNKCVQPPGLNDFGLTNCSVINPCTPGPANLHVTQKVAFNKLSDLKKALDYLSP